MKNKMNFRKFCSKVAAALAVALCLTMFPVQTQAAGTYTVRLAGSDGSNVITARPGDTVTLVLRLENNPGIIGVGVQMQYPAGFSLAEKPSNVSGFNEVGSGIFITSETLDTNPYLLWWNYALGDEDRKLITVQGNLAQIRLTVANDTVAGDYPITLTAPADKNTTADTDGSGVILDNTNTAIAPALVDCTIRVDDACQHSFGAWTDVPGNAPTCTTGGSQTRACSLCGEPETRQVGAKGHTYEDGACSVCGEPWQVVRGDIDGNGIVTSDDVIRLLLYVSMPSMFPIDAEADFTGEGSVTSDDVIRLLLYVSMPGMFPL